MQLPITSRQVIGVTFDFAVTPIIDGGAELRLEAPFSLSVAERSAAIDPWWIDDMGTRRLTDEALFRYLGLRPLV